MIDKKKYPKLQFHACNEGYKWYKVNTIKEPMKKKPKNPENKRAKL